MCYMREQVIEISISLKILTRKGFRIGGETNVLYQKIRMEKA